MLRARALADLFTENLDAVAKGMLLTTVSGNVCGKDKNMTDETGKKVSALGTLTWRVHSALLQGEDPSKVSRAQPLEIIETTMSEDGRSLISLVIDSHGQAISFEYIGANLLLGVLGFELADESTGQGEEDELSSSHSDDSSEEPKKLKALRLKTLALADYLRGELADFHMPSSFE